MNSRHGRFRIWHPDTRQDERKRRKMSSILRALKKVEKNRTAGKEMIGYPSMDSKMVLHRKMHRSFPVMRYAVVLLILGGLAGGGGWLIRGRVPESSGPVVPLHAPTTSPAIPAASIQTDSPAPAAPGPPPEAPSDAVARHTGPGGDAVRHPRFDHEHRQKPPFGPIALKKASQERLTAGNHEVPEEASKEPYPSSPSSPAVSGSDEGASATTGRLKKADPSWLQLQAISWAADSDRRMAVINNRIVHEGEMVDKGLIVRIDKDSVIVRRDGEEWRVHFDLK
jgi:hypothetical protein